MVSKIRKNCFANKLTAIFVLSAVLSCHSAFADGEFSYFEFNEKPSIKLINPIYLDTTRTEKIVPKTNTIIPHNLRGEFDESDYFSSNNDDLPQSNSPPSLDFAD